jgi:hypothetical protein
MQWLIGVDDTDNLESRGTGHRARRLGQLLAEAGLAVVQGITRHQLLVDPRIPYTSHNSSACLTAEAPEDRVGGLRDLCADYLLKESAPGSDAGLCIASWSAVSPAVKSFARRAQTEVLTRDEAASLAKSEGIILEGLTGDGGGIIGSLAAVGLRVVGNGGRFLWLAGLRELTGIHSLEQLRSLVGIDEITTVEGTVVPDSALIDVGPWPRPILRNGRAVLLVEEVENGASHWQVVHKEVIKQY